MKRDVTFDTINHGTTTGYGYHNKHKIDFPEDAGGEPCGCREAWALYQDAYKKGKGSEYRKKYGAARNRALSRLAERFPAEYKTYLDIEMTKEQG